MKTILDKLPLQITAGRTITFELPEPFRVKDSLFLLVHNSLNEDLTLTLSNAKGEALSNHFTLTSFPAIVVFPLGKEAERGLANDTLYTRVSVTSFHDFGGSLTYRVRNPLPVIAAYRKG